MAVPWNLVEAGVVFIPLPMQIYPRLFFFTQKAWPLYRLPLKVTSSRLCICSQRLPWGPQTTPARTVHRIQPTVKSVCSRGQIISFLPFIPDILGSPCLLLPQARGHNRVKCQRNFKWVCGGRGKAGILGQRADGRPVTQERKFGLLK